MYNLEEKIKKIFSKNNFKISQKQKIIFFDNLYNLINSGIPITNSFTILLYQTKDKNLKNIIQLVLKDISKGKKLQDSFGDFPKNFSIFDINMIKVGELTGKLSNSLEIITKREEKNYELKSKVLGALIYPIIIIILSICMIFGFMIFVIPKVQKMYVDARINLPPLTQSVINISDFLKNNFEFLIIGMFLLFFIFLQLLKNNKIKIFFDKILLEIPIFGSLQKKKILSIFTNTLGILLENGIMINEALEISKKSVENKYFEEKINKILPDLNNGTPLSELMGINNLKLGIEDNLFPLELASAIKIGEQTGKLPNLLIKFSQKYNKEIDSLVKNLSTMIEPIVIIFVGSIVGVMIMAILLPFFNMVNVM